MEAFEPELESYLTPDELGRLAEARQTIDKHWKELNKKYDEIARELDEIEKSTEAPLVSQCKLLFPEVQLSLLRLYNEPSYAYEEIKELAAVASQRKADREAEMERRRAQQERARLAEMERERKVNEYMTKFNIQMKTFKATLSEKKRRVRFPKDARDLGYDFSYLLSADDKAPYLRVAEELVNAFVPDDLSQFIHSDYKLSYRLLPYAVYRLVHDVPCLNVIFEINIAVQIAFWVKSARVKINGYEFDLPLVEYRVTWELGDQTMTTSYTGPLTEPYLLGYDSLVLSTDALQLNKLGYKFWQVVPCVLIEGFMQGDPEPEGCTITEAYEARRTYAIDGFSEEVDIPDYFSRYFKQIGSWDTLVEKGIISSEIAVFIKKAIERLRANKIPELGPSEEGELVGALIGLGWSKTQAREAADYVIKKLPNISLEEKIKSAMQFLNPQVTN